MDKRYTKKERELFFKALATEAGLSDEKLVKEIYYAIIRVALKNLVADAKYTLPDLLKMRVREIEQPYTPPGGKRTIIRVKKLNFVIDKKIRKYIKEADINFPSE